MIKADLIEKVTNDTKLTKKDSDRSIDTISRALAKGDKVTLIGFGSFEVRKRAAQKGRNPQTGKSISSPVKCRYFKPKKR